MGQLNTIRNAHVWHEFGHLFAYCLMDSIGFNLGKVVRIKLEETASTTLDKELYFKAGQYDEGVDCYGLQNMKFSDEQEIELKTKISENPAEAIGKLVAIISGGLFNLYPFFYSPTQGQFDNCYSNTNNPDIKNGYIGCAGNDWDKSRRIACYLGWSPDKLIKLRNGLFEIFKDLRIFNIFKPMINNVQVPTILQDSELDAIIMKTNSIVNDGNNKCKMRIRQLIELHN